MSRHEQSNIVLQVRRQTLSDRINGTHKPRHEISEASWHLNDAQQNVTNEWLIQSSRMATPLHPRDLRAHVLDLTGKLPGANWPWKYLKQNSNILRVSKPSHLDPKRAQNFNRTNVEGYFQLRAQIEEQYGGIPPEHHWNEDEKGIQMGGGQNGLGLKFIFAAEARERYRQHSDNLELVTILDCANAAGYIMRPYFVLKDGQLPDSRGQEFDRMGG